MPPSACCPRPPTPWPNPAITWCPSPWPTKPSARTACPPDAIHQLPIDKLRKIFGADAALYINVTQYGTSYKIISSETRVTADGELIDLRNGRSLWKGHATASSAEGDNNNNNGLVGMLVKALVNQIADSINDRGHTIAGITSFRLLAAGSGYVILYGPRSPHYLKEGGPDH